MKISLILILLSVTVSLWAIPKKSQIDRENQQIYKEYFESLSPMKQIWLNEKFAQIENEASNRKNSGFIEINFNHNSDIYFLIQGLPTGKFPEFYKPFILLKNADKTTYFQTLYNSLSAKKNIIKIKNSLFELSLKYPQKKIIVMGHCTGGTLALVALKELQQEDLAENIELITIASPLNGYGAPAIAEVASIFNMRLTVDIGRGLTKLLPKNMSNCRHVITNNQSLDFHARIIGKRFPQLLYADKKIKNFDEAFAASNFPCTDLPVEILSDERHGTSISLILSDILSK